MGSKENPTLYHYSKPLLFILRMGGLFYLPEKVEINLKLKENSDENINLTQKGRRQETFFKYWSWFAFTCTLAYFGKFLWSFQDMIRLMGNPVNGKNLPDFVFLCTYLNWFIQFISWHFLMIRACRNKLFIKLFNQWEILRFECPDQTCSSFTDYFKPRRNKTVFVSVFLVLVNVQSVWAPVLIDDGTYSAQRFVMYAGFEGHWHVVATVIMLIGHLFASFVYMTPVMLLALLGHALYSQFRHLRRYMEKNITAAGELIEQSVEWYRQKHERLCTLVDVIDGIFAPIVFLAVFQSVIELFMLMFVVVDYTKKGKHTTVTAVSLFFWAVFHIVQLITVIGMGIKVNEAAHSPLASLYKLDNTKLRPGEIFYLHTFISKLSGNQIGFTASRLFTIDASSVLSIVGMYITYQLLLFQLQMDLTSADEVAAAAKGNASVDQCAGFMKTLCCK